MPEPAATPPTDRTRVQRLADRGCYDRSTIRGILDEGLVCHVGLAEGGGPVVIPVAYGVDDDFLYLHGSVASRLLRALAKGAPLCATVTLLDGIVFARSLFNHSMNYRSVVVFGNAEEISDLEEKEKALAIITEHLVPGRWDEARQPTKNELLKTLVLRVPWAESSAKLRTGPPHDEEEDYELDVWAGVVPLQLTAGAPEPDPRMEKGIATPRSALEYRSELRGPRAVDEGDE